MGKILYAKYTRIMTLFLTAMVLCTSLGLSFSYAAESWTSIHTSYYKDADISVSIEGKKMFVTVPDTSDYKYIVSYFMDSSGTEPEELYAVETDAGTVEYTLRDRSDGLYYIQLYKPAGDGNDYVAVIGGTHSISVRFVNNVATIESSRVYDQQAELFNSKSSSVDALYHYLQPSENVQSDDAAVISLADEITADSQSAYDSVKKIHDWVAGNIYYDNDAVENLENSPAITWPLDAVGTLEKRRTVCEGYANLLTALMRAEGIPARTIIGYALTDESIKWNSQNTKGTVANHAWNEVFVQGRWILMDPTWDSNGSYYKGEFIDGSSESTYYDNTIEFFSYTHRQSVSDTYNSAYIQLDLQDIASHWAYDYIKFTVNNDMMNGVGNSLFAPDTQTTQAMFLTVLARLSGDDTGILAEGADWYESYVTWASENGILKDIPEFSPESVISREMMAVMLVNYADYEGLIEETTQQSSFNDYDEISDWARDEVSQAASWGVITGREDGNFDPAASFTRAEMATIMTRVAEKQLLQYVG